MTLFGSSISNRPTDLSLLKEISKIVSLSNSYIFALLVCRPEDLNVHIL